MNLKTDSGRATFCFLLLQFHFGFLWFWFTSAGLLCFWVFVEHRGISGSFVHQLVYFALRVLSFAFVNMGTSARIDS